MQSAGIVVALVGAGVAFFSLVGGLVMIVAGLAILAVGLMPPTGDGADPAPSTSHQTVASPTQAASPARQPPRRHACKCG
mgnify:CR=1 FL=1